VSKNKNVNSATSLTKHHSMKTSKGVTVKYTHIQPRQCDVSVLFPALTALHL